MIQNPLIKESLIWLGWILFSILHGLSFMPMFATVMETLLPVIPESGFLHAIFMLLATCLIVYWGTIGVIGAHLIEKSCLVRGGANLRYFWAGIVVLIEYLRIGGYIPYPF